MIIERCGAEVWDLLRGQRVFITGGTGFVGCWLLEALLWAEQELSLGVELTVLTRNASAFRTKAPHLCGHAAVTLVEGQVSDLSALHGPYDSIVHAATDVVHPDQSAAEVYQQIVEGAKQTLALAERCGARRYLLTSSGAVYGRQDPLVSHRPDDDPGQPGEDDAYGRGKRAAEACMFEHAARHGLTVTSARIFALLGPYLPLDAQFAVGNFIADALAGCPIAVRGDGTACRSYLYCADLAVWLLTILARGAGGQSYNVGSEHAVSIGELAGHVAAQMPGAIPVHIAQRAKPDSLPQRYVPDTGKARTALGLAEFTDLQTALEKTIAWSGRRAMEHDHV
jgi:dTDP-glucose 4,6-dehydratase